MNFGMESYENFVTMKLKSNEDDSSWDLQPSVAFEFYLNSTRYKISVHRLVME